MPRVNILPTDAATLAANDFHDKYGPPTREELARLLDAHAAEREAPLRAELAITKARLDGTTNAIPILTNEYERRGWERGVREVLRRIEARASEIRSSGQTGHAVASVVEDVARTECALLPYTPPPATNETKEEDRG